MSGPLRLTDISPCFAGEVPASMATCSAAGEPNIVHVTQVIFVDDEHVAVSDQFLGKTARNIAENPIATLLCAQPVDGTTFKLLVQHARNEHDGPVFHAVKSQVAAVAAMTGMEEVFELRSIVVFRVLEIIPVMGRNHTVPS